MTALAFPVDKRNEQQKATDSVNACSAIDIESASISGATVSKNPFGSKKVAENRVNRVAKMQMEYDEIRSKTFGKNPLSFTRDEQLEVLALRFRIQQLMRNIGLYKEPYINQLMEQLKSMRNGLPRHADYVDKSSESYQAERRLRLREGKKRYRTRKKVQNLGIHIPIRYPAPLQEAASPFILKRRASTAASHRRAKKRKELDRLFEQGWGLTGHRS